MTQTLASAPVDPGFQPEPVSSRIFVRCYRRYEDAKRAYDQLCVVGHIPDKRMTVVARGLEWRETLPPATLYKLSCGLAAAIGGAVGLLLWMIGFAATDSNWFAQTAFGALAGLLAGFCAATAVAYLRRGAVATGHVEPRQYDILVEEELAPAAREVLGAATAPRARSGSA
jgi:hypothetical protein